MSLTFHPELFAKMIIYAKGKWKQKETQIKLMHLIVRLRRRGRYRCHSCALITRPSTGEHVSQKGVQIFFLPNLHFNSSPGARKTAVILSIPITNRDWLRVQGLGTRFVLTYCNYCSSIRKRALDYSF